MLDLSKKTKINRTHTLLIATKLFGSGLGFRLYELCVCVLVGGDMVVLVVRSGVTASLSKVRTQIVMWWRNCEVKEEISAVVS